LMLSSASRAVQIQAPSAPKEFHRKPKDSAGLHVANV
jgi:hypothetical protein